VSLFYEAGAIEVTWLGIDLARGWNSLTFEPNNPAVTYTVSADGVYTFSKSSDNGCTISLTLPQTSPLNKVISFEYSLQRQFGEALQFAPFTVIDPTGDSASFVALNAVLTEQPSNSFEAEAGDKTWVWVCETYIMSDNPASILATLDSYIKPIPSI